MDGVTLPIPAEQPETREGGGDALQARAAARRAEPVPVSGKASIAIARSAT